MTRFIKSHWAYLSLATAILSLAMGVNMLVLAIVNALWLRPLPVAEPERVVTILQSRSTVASLDSPYLSVFDGPVAGQVVTTGFNEAFRPQIFFPQIGGPLEVLGVSPRYFDVLGVPLRGRGFTQTDELDGAEAVTLAIAIVGTLWSVMNGRLTGEMSAGSATVPAAAVRVRRRLLALQVCATTVVLVASGLFVRTVLYSFRVASGIDIDRTVFVSVQEKPLRGLESPPASGVSPLAAGNARRDQLADVFRRLPSVRDVAGGTPPIGAAALTTSTPLPHTFNIAGRQVSALVGVMWGTPNLLSVLGVPLLAGRALDARDAPTVDPISAVITRSLAQRLWPTGDALGQVLVSGSGYPRRSLIVGIAEDFAFGTLSRPVDGVLVIARGDSDFRVSNMVLRTDDPRAVAAAVPAVLADRVVRVTTGREVVARDIAQQRLGAWMFSGFGLVALALGIGGVFGLVAYLAHARQREFGIRMVLGATWPRLLQTAVTAAVWPTAIGMFAGMLMGAAVSRVFAALLVGINGPDPWTYASVGLVVLVPALLAALAAAWRLRRITPGAALRCS
jgi:hypothetical protein